MSADPTSLHPDSSLAALRVVAAAIGLPFCVLALLVLATALKSKLTVLGSGLILAPGTVAAICGWFACRGHIAKARVQIAHAALGAVIGGCIGLVSGFLGPLLFAPGSNQGPLLGIFVTGPFGIVAGALIGALAGILRSRRPPRQG
jgi:hypothetical protein